MHLMLDIMQSGIRTPGNKSIKSAVGSIVNRIPVLTFLFFTNRKMIICTVKSNAVIPVAVPEKLCFIILTAQDVIMQKIF